MEGTVYEYKNYTIDTEEGEQKGIFFRNPLQKIYYEAYCNVPDPKMSAWVYLEAIAKNPIRRFYERIIGNGQVIKNIREWAEHDNWAGFKAYRLFSPIYFTRQYRKLTAQSDVDNFILAVESYGYEPPFNITSGTCHIEKAVIRLRDGKRVKITRKGNYHFTYAHVVTEMIDTQIVTK